MGAEFPERPPTPPSPISLSFEECCAKYEDDERFQVPIDPKEKERLYAARCA